MTILDDERDFIDPATVSVFPTALRVGLIGGLIMIIYGLLGNILGFSRPTSGFLLLMLNVLVVFILFIGILIYAVKSHRDQDLGGYISFGRILLLGVIVSVVSGLMGAISNYGYVTLIEPDFAQNMIYEMEEMFERLGLPEDEIETQLETMEEGFQPLKMFTNSILYSIGGGVFFSAIIGLIMKKNLPKR